VIRPGAADFYGTPGRTTEIAGTRRELTGIPSDRQDARRTRLAPEVAGGEVYWRRTVVGEEMPLSNHLFP
jgi:hypothetical protein